MSELGSGGGTDYPSALDTDNTLESDGVTTARADVPNDLGAAIVAIENELGTNPSGTKADVKTFLQTEHNTNGTHNSANVVMIAGPQTITGEKLFTETLRLTKGSDVASATTLSLGAGNYFDITGTTTITGITSIGIGTWVRLHFDGALTLTHHATNFVLPGGADITTAAGDEFEFTEYATGDWRMISTSQFTRHDIVSGGSQAVGAGATWTVPKGVFNITASDVTVMRLELNVASTWRGSGGQFAGFIVSDGTNVRLNNTSGSGVTVYYQKFT